MPKVVVLGSINIDLVVRCSRRPGPGETVFGSGHQIIPGGKGANQACAAARMGATTSLIGYVGTDGLGKIILGSLEAAGVDISAVGRSGKSPTGAAFITLDEKGENTIICSPAANNEITATCVREREALIGEADLLICNMEVPLEAVEEALRLAHRHGVNRLVNLAPPVPVGDDSPVWNATILVANELEGAWYTGMPIDSPEEARKAAEKLLGRGAETVILTLGGKGSIAVAAGSEYVSPAVKTRVVDTTAAGDTYIGAFGVEWIRTKDIQASMDFGSGAAGLAVTRLGAQSSIPTEPAVRALLSQRQQPV